MFFPRLDPSRMFGQGFIQVWFTSKKEKKISGTMAMANFVSEGRSQALYFQFTKRQYESTYIRKVFLILILYFYFWTVYF